MEIQARAERSAPLRGAAPASGSESEEDGGEVVVPDRGRPTWWEEQTGVGKSTGAITGLHLGGATQFAVYWSD